MRWSACNCSQTNLKRTEVNGQRQEGTGWRVGGTRGGGGWEVCVREREWGGGVGGGGS